MSGTRLKNVIRESLGTVWREVKIALTPIPDPPKWLFLVGCYNSGTTLLAELLSRHPDITSLPDEGHFLTDQFTKDFEIGIPRMWVARESLFRMDEHSTGPDPVRIKREWGMRASGKGSCFLEKSPPNSARTRWLQAHFQEAYFVVITRNGYAVAEGIHRKGDPKHLDEGWPMREAAYQWHRNNQVLREDAQHLNHVKWVTYENLCNDPAGMLDSILQFVGLETGVALYDQGRLKIHERNDEIKNMNHVSIKNMSAEDIAVVNEVASESLHHFGYEIIDPSVGVGN